MKPEAGRVWLVGAGPGDPGLLTVRGRELLQAADVVLFDRLGGSEMLHLVRTDAELIDVSKTPGGPTVPQESINAMLVEHAEAGRLVVRLKGGDPFVYGRGAEEIDACRAAGIPCEVVPGLTSALAGPSAAGIPVTLRGVARTLSIATPVTGIGEHEQPPDYTALARTDTAVFLMGVGKIAEVAAGLLGAGRDPATPAAIIERATLPDQRVTRTTLGSMASDAERRGVRPPAVLVVGETAALAVETDPAAGPLAGKRVLITRPATANARLAEALRERGAEPVRVPLIEIRLRDPDGWSGDLGPAEWLVFTSLHGVRGFWDALRARGLDARAVGDRRIACVGPRTARELRQFGLHADLVPEEHRAAALIESLAERIRPGTPVLFPCGTLALEETTDGLTRLGASVERLVVYETLDRSPTAAERAELERGFDAVLFYAPSGVRSAVALGLDCSDAVVGCIGPTTARAAEDAGYRVDLVPEAYSDAGLIRALECAFEGSPVGPSR